MRIEGGVCEMGKERLQGKVGEDYETRAQYLTRRWHEVLKERPLRPEDKLQRTVGKEA